MKTQEEMIRAIYEALFPPPSDKQTKREKIMAELDAKDEKNKLIRAAKKLNA